MATRSTTRKTENFRYDVSLSFAGEDRDYVEKVANALVNLGVRVFYDRYEQVELWGRDLYTHLSDVYSSAARYCILFASRHYADKVWTNHERAAAQDRAIREHREYILPVRFDNTTIPGIRGTVAYLDLKGIKPRKLAGMIREKLGGGTKSQLFTPNA